MSSWQIEIGDFVDHHDPSAAGNISTSGCGSSDDIGPMLHAMHACHMRSIWHP